MYPTQQTCCTRIKINAHIYCQQAAFYALCLCVHFIQVYKQLLAVSRIEGMFVVPCTNVCTVCCLATDDAYAIVCVDTCICTYVCIHICLHAYVCVSVCVCDLHMCLLLHPMQVSALPACQWLQKYAIVSSPHVSFCLRLLVLISSGEYVSMSV